MPPPAPPALAGTANEYAAGPARAATTAAARDAASSRIRLPERKTNRPTTASAMTTAMAGHSQVFQSVARRNSTTAQMPVTASPAGSTQDQRTSPPRKARNSMTPPPPHRAAMPGATAVV